MNLDDYIKEDGKGIVIDWSRLHVLEDEDNKKADDIFWCLVEKGILAERPKPGTYCVVFEPAGINKNPGIEFFYFVRKSDAEAYKDVAYPNDGNMRIKRIK